ncbi:MAG: hypothetical protein HJJLKODD_00389 [Phycisphaerae bacterium]|nr:hypothetical protein [Phycisphaerae bacterium]
MRELALHLLDLVENSIRVGATRIGIHLQLDRAGDWLMLRVKDNGPGLSVRPEEALNPFYTTKSGKRTGLGLSLLQSAAEQTGGGLGLWSCDWGGLEVWAKFRWSHVDRYPLGEWPETLAGMVSTRPEIEFLFELQLDDRILTFQSTALRNPESTEAVDSIQLYGRVLEALQSMLSVEEFRLFHEVV